MSDFSLSFDDIRALQPFSNLTEFDLLHPSSDGLVHPYLHAMGCDLDYPIEIIANLHRTHFGKKHLGYCWRGSLRHDRSFLESSICSLIDRLSVLSFYDTSLVFEMISLTGNRVSYSTFNSVDESSNYKLPADQLSEDWKEVERDIEILNRIIVQVRGKNIND